MQRGPPCPAAAVAAAATRRPTPSPRATARLRLPPTLQGGVCGWHRRLFKGSDAPQGRRRRRVLPAESWRPARRGRRGSRGRRVWQRRSAAAAAAGADAADGECAGAAAAAGSSGATAATELGAAAAAGVAFVTYITNESISRTPRSYFVCAHNPLLQTQACAGLCVNTEPFHLHMNSSVAGGGRAGIVSGGRAGIGGRVGIGNKNRALGHCGSSGGRACAGRVYAGKTRQRAPGGGRCAHLRKREGAFFIIQVSRIQGSLAGALLVRCFCAAASCKCLVPML